jgi:hypothetical protein
VKNKNKLKLRQKIKFNWKEKNELFIKTINIKKILIIQINNSIQSFKKNNAFLVLIQFFC